MTDKIELRSDFDVELSQISGSDQYICQAARVSTLGAESFDTDESEGLINFLMKNRHGSPFEHGLFGFRINAPIFVWREFMRHRIGFSYNEQSGRYMELSPVFYVPPTDRALVQVGKPGAYEYVPGSSGQYLDARDAMVVAYERSWWSYKRMLSNGVAKEVARMCLPVSIYSAAYVTCNPRSMMAFLSLRTKVAESMFPSFPMWEINQVALQMEYHFIEKFPLTHSAFTKNRRVSP